MERSEFLYLLFLVIAVFSFPGLMIPGLAEAHAAFVRSDPAPGASLEKPPQQVTIWCSQELARDSQIKVFDKAEQRVDLDNTRVSFADPKSMAVGLRSLPPGAYRIDWESVSLEDGDREKGSFSFSVGGGGGGVNVALIAGIVVGILVAGIALFALLRRRRGGI